MSGENWVAVGNRGELDEGAMKGIELGDLQIAIYNVEGEIYATDNICTHAFAMLTDGFLDGDVIECPLHGGCFKVRPVKAWARRSPKTSRRIQCASTATLSKSILADPRSAATALFHRNRRCARMMRGLKGY